MPAIAKDRQNYHLSKIRSLIAEDHQATFEEITERLDQRYGLKLDRHYITKLTKKIYAERAKRADRYTLIQALTSFEDTMTQVVRVAWSIANDTSARRQDRVMALREVREAHKDMFEKLFDAGVFERKLGTIDATIRNTPLSDEKKQAIVVVFQNWGLVPPPQEDARPTTTEPQ